MMKWLQLRGTSKAIERIERAGYVVLPAKKVAWGHPWPAYGSPQGARRDMAGRTEEHGGIHMNH